MGDAGAAGQDLRKFTVLRMGVLAEEDRLDACRAPGAVSRARGRLERIPRVCMSAPVGGPRAIGVSLVCTSIVLEDNDTAVVDAGAMPRARERKTFLGPRIRLGVVYQHTVLVGDK